MEQKAHGVLYSSKKSPNFVVRKISKKVSEVITWFLSSLVFCCPRKLIAPRNGTRFEELPNEILLKIVGYCDFASKMNMRAVSYRFCALVEKSAHAVRHNLIGGVEIRRGDGDGNDIFDLGDHFGDFYGDVSSTMHAKSASGEHHSFTCSSFYVTLCRPLKRMELLVPATRLPNIMRHVCVCHSFKLCGIPLDEGLASNILDASFRAVNDVVIDRVHTVTAETLVKLVDKLHHMFDDSALVRLVISDHAIRRNVRLPLCAITHRGISRAAQAFYKRCCDVMAEVTAEMHAPKWEISVSFPSSILIDRNLIEVPIEMRGQFTIWSLFPPYNDGFTVEVRVGGMNLKIIVESS
ncbi:F-box domain protein [Ostertagia ostertagi]